MKTVHTLITVCFVLIILCLFISCNKNKSEDETTQDYLSREKGLSTVVLDSCEYLQWENTFISNSGMGYSQVYLAHKGNCKFCRAWEAEKELMRYGN